MIARVFRTIIAVVAWPFLAVADRLRGVYPPARFATGLAWAREPVRTVYIDREPGDDEYGCCALAPDHVGACQWKCSTCGGTGRCPECHDVIEDDIDWCDFCDNGGCPGGCYEGWITEDVSVWMP